MREEKGKADQGFRPMRALVVASLVSSVSLASLGGCIDNDKVRVQSFSAGPNGGFTYSAQTNTVMTANSDGAAEQIRRDWLAQTLEGQGMCRGGYAIYQRHLVVPPQETALAGTPGSVNPAVAPTAPVYFGNGGDVVYSGSCL
jgi:hypothetical protein